MIVLLSHSQDFFTIDRVAEHLTRLGAEFVRLNTDALPFYQPLSARWGDDQATEVLIEFENGPHALPIDSVRSVWNRSFDDSRGCRGIEPRLNRSPYRAS